MKQKLLNSFKLRALMLVAILCAAFTGTAWGETATLVSGSGSSGYSVPDNWTTSGTVEGGSYLKFDNGTITSPEFAPHNNLSFTYTVATFGSGTNHPLTIRILNASTNAVIIEKTTATPTSSSYISTDSPLSIGNVNVAFKIQLYGPTGKGVRLRNYSITGTPTGGSTPTPSLSVNPASVAFGDKAINSSNTQTFDVTFSNLTQDLSVSVGSGLTGVTVSPSSISKTAASPQTVTITYAPTAVGNINGNITVSNTDDEVSKTVAVTASAYDPSNITYYKKVTTGQTDWSGEYIFTGINSGNYYALTGVSSNLGTTAQVTVTDNNITSTSTTDSYKVTVAKIANTDNYSLYMDGVGYLSYSSTKNELNASEELGDEGKWSISFSNDVVTISNVKNESRILQFNFNSGNSRFACYTSAQVKLTLFKYDDGNPSITASDVNIAYDATGGSFDYTINNPVEGGVVSVDFDSDDNWLLSATESNGTVSFTCTANATNAERQALVEITYTYNTNETVTKDVWITQAAAPVIYSNIPTLFAAATTTETAVKVTFDSWVVSGVSTNGKDVFVTDNAGNGFVIFDNNGGLNNTYAVGSILSGTAVTCNLVLYNGFAEIKNLNASDLTISTGGTVTAANVAMANLAGVNTGALVSYQNLTCSVDNNKYYLSDGTTTLQVYNALFAFDALEAGKTYNITGVYQQYNTTKEILPRSADDIEEVQFQHQDYDLTVTLNDNVSAIYVFDAADRSNPLIADGAAGTVQVADATQVLVSPDVASGYVLGSLTVAGVDVTEEMNEGSYTFTMPAHAVAITATAVPVKTYTLASSITSGKHYIIVNKDAEKAMGAQGNNNRAAADVTIDGQDGQTASVVSNAGVAEFVIYGPDAKGSYTIYDAAYNNNEGGYLYAASSGSNYLRTETELDENGNGLWAISIDNAGVASIIAQGTNTRKEMHYNNSNKLFACYAEETTTQQPVYLYEKDGEATPTESKTLNGYGYATYASQNALDFTNATDVTAWTITGINGNEITFRQIEGSAPAGTGMLLKGTANASVTMTSATGATALTGNLLEGTTADKTITDDQYFGLKGNEFVPVNAGIVPAGKALLPVSALGNNYGAKAFTFVFETADGIQTVETVSAAEAAEIFNLAGQRLQKAQRGVNIINGKKVLVK